MKKFAAIAVAASMFALAACNGDKTDTAPTPPPQDDPGKVVKNPKPCNPQSNPGGKCPDIP